MKKILIAEVAVLLGLLVVALVVRFAFAPARDDLRQPDTNQTTGSTEAIHVMATDPTPGETEPQPEPSRPVITEPDPEAVLEEMELSARNAFAYNLESGTVYYLGGGWTAQLYPASVTKLFSAYVALQYLDPTTVITAGDELDLVAEDSSIAYIHKGNKLTAAMLVEGMLLPSGNDAAYILATAAARAESGNPSMSPKDAIAHFVKLMNATAQKLGMTGSHFCNPDGYHNEDHYTCARDLVTIARLALENEVIRGYAGKYEDSVVYASGHTNRWHNTNSLVNPNSPYYCANAVGLKTGKTSAAGSCLLSAFLVDGEYVIVGTFGCAESADRFKDTLKLYNALMNIPK